MVTKEITTLSITNSDQDLLGRENIVTAITNKIVERSKSNIHCEVIGVYSKWGEGKTSVLNLVKEQLKIRKGDKKRDIRCIDFNPWLFKDQESLLLDFFKVLQKGVTDNDVREKLKQYGPLVALGAKGLINIIAPGIGAIAGDAVEKVIKSISDVEIDVQSLKKEIDDQIKLTNEHYLIFIDDVDRLDKDELHALFKLIRQNADFVNTTYVIAMDVDMVAKSIGNRFEEGCTEAGKNFLEKIVQYPIHLPTVQRGKLHRIFKKAVTDDIKELYSQSSGVRTHPWEELESSLSTIIFPLFSSVREILIYKRSLFFILPSIYREINISDLCMLEALKLFHSEAYHLIRNNKSIVTNTQNELRYFNETVEQKKKRINLFIESLSKNAPLSTKHQVENIITKLLFPITSSNNSDLNIENDKGLCSTNYFDKYFLYTTPDDMISDTETDCLIEILPSISQDDLSEKLERYFSVYGFEELRRIIYQILNITPLHNIDNDCINKVCIALSHLSVNKKRKQYTEHNTRIHIEIFIVIILNSYMYELKEDKIGLSRHQNEAKQIETFKKIVESDELIPFHLFFATHFIQEGTAYQNNKEEIGKSVCNLINKYIEQHSLADIFELSEIPINTLFSVWKELDEEEYYKAINEYMFNGDFALVPFLQKMVDRELTDDLSFKHISYEKYNKFASLFDVDKIYEKVKNLKPKDIEDYNNTIGYFIQGYNQQKNLNNDNIRLRSTSNQITRIK